MPPPIPFVPQNPVALGSSLTSPIPIPPHSLLSRPHSCSGVPAPARRPWPPPHPQDGPPAPSSVSALWSDRDCPAHCWPLHQAPRHQGRGCHSACTPSADPGALWEVWQAALVAGAGGTEGGPHVTEAPSSWATEKNCTHQLYSKHSRLGRGAAGWQGRGRPRLRLRGPFGHREISSPP